MKSIKILWTLVILTLILVFALQSFSTMTMHDPEFFYWFSSMQTQMEKVFLVSFAGLVSSYVLNSWKRDD